MMSARSSGRPSRFEDLMRSSGRDVAVSRPILALARAEERVGRVLDQALHESGLTPAKFNVLMELASVEDHRLPLRDICRRLIRSAPNITALVDRLEQDGLVRRVRDEDDRRVVHAEITERGWEALCAAAPAVFEAERSLLQDLSTADRRALIRVLGAVATNGGE